MKRSFVLLALCVVISVTSSCAQGRFGFGVVLGEPTGLSGMYRIDRSNAVDGVLGFAPEDRFRIHMDYLWIRHPFGNPSFSLHYGVGGVIGFGRTMYLDARDGYFVRTRELGFGARVPLGVDFEIPRSPCELYFEIAPLLILGPDAGVGLDFGFGFRIYP
ncbi:MAG: DUF3996 domain-containing protein [Bacteroidota bacterium]